MSGFKYGTNKQTRMLFADKESFVDFCKIEEIIEEVNNVKNEQIYGL